MPGRIVYFPTEPHSCSGQPDPATVPAGTKWQCEDCWAIWWRAQRSQLDCAMNNKPGPYWERSPHQHSGPVVVNGNGEVIDTPNAGGWRAVARPEDYDIKPISKWVFPVVLLAAVAVAVAIVVWWPR